MKKKETKPVSIDTDPIGFMNYVQKARRAMTTSEEKKLVELIITKAKVAYHFFFAFLLPMMNGFKYEFDIDNDVKDICSLVYAVFCEGNRWTRLKVFRFESSLLGWVKTLSKQIILHEANKEGLFFWNPKRTANNTRLTVLSLPTDEERQMVVDLVDSPKQNRLLTLVYVEKLDAAKVCERMGMDAESLGKALKQAETSLKNKLIQADCLLTKRSCKGGRTVTVNLVTEALSDARPLDVEMSYGEAYDNAAATTGYEQPSIGDSIFDECYPGAPRQMQNELFTKRIIAEMEWCTTMEKTIFAERYVRDTLPTSLAHDLGCRRDYIDMSYARTKQIYDSYTEKRQGCDAKNRQAAAAILHYSSSDDGLDMPKDSVAISIVCKTLSRNELLMCQRIAKIYTGEDYEGEKLLKLLQDAGIVNKLSSAQLNLMADVSETAPGKGSKPAPKKRFSPVQHYHLSSVYVVRNINKDIAAEINGFAGSLLHQWRDADGHRLSASIGLTLMKHCIMAFG